MNKNELTRSILEEIGYGTLSATETECRLNGLIDRELTRPLGAPVNAALIDLCSALILRLHGAEPVTKSASAMADAVMDRLRREKKKTSVRRWLRPLAAAAALVLVAVVSLGLIHFHWFTGHSTENQTQFIIEGREIKTGKTAEAHSEAATEDVRSFTTSTWDFLRSFLSFDPCLPGDIGGTWKPVRYDARKSPQKIDVTCVYAMETEENGPDQVTFTLSIYRDPALVLSPDSFGEGGYLQLAGTRVYRYIAADPGHIAWSWRRGNALLTLDAPLTASLPETAVETVIRSQAEVTLDESVLFSEVDFTPEQPGKKPRMSKRLIRERLGSESDGAVISHSLIELEEHLRFSFGDIDILPDEWTFRQARTITDKDSVLTDIDYAGTDDPERTFRLSIKAMPYPEDPPATGLRAGGRTEKLNGTDVRITREGNCCMFTWSDDLAVYRVTFQLAEAEIQPAVSALIAGTAPVVPEASETPPITPTPVPTPTIEKQEHVVPTATPVAEEITSYITAEMTRETISLHSKGGSLATDSLASLGEYLGHPMPQWDLSPIGWTFNNSWTYVSDDRVSTTIQYIGTFDPADEFMFSCDQFTDPESARLQMEQNSHGIYKTVMGKQLYITENDGRTLYVWQEGMTICVLWSQHPLEVLDTAVSWMLGDRSMLDPEVPPEDEVFIITEDTIRQATAGREDAGLAGPLPVTPEIVSAAIDRLSDQDNLVIRSKDLTFLSDQLGFSLDLLTLEDYSWHFVDGEAIPLENSLLLIMKYEHPCEPQTRMNVRIEFHLDIEELYMSFEQDKEGVWKRINGYNVYTYTNCGRTGYLWFDGMVMYNVASGHPAAVLEPIVDHFTRSASSPAAPVAQRQAHRVTGEDMLRGAAERRASGLPDGGHPTEGQISAILEDPSGYPDIHYYADSLDVLSTRLGFSMHHLGLDQIGWELNGVTPRLKGDHIEFDIIYRKDIKENTFAHLLIFSFADPASAQASVMQDGEGTHRTVNGYDIYTYTNGGRPGCVWYDGCNIYLLTVDQPEDAARIAEELARQL